jgi:hypothetical protein
MPYDYATDPAPKKASLKPFLLFALTLAVLAFCTTLWVR